MTELDMETLRNVIGKWLAINHEYGDEDAEFRLSLLLGWLKEKSGWGEVGDE